MKVLIKIGIFIARFMSAIVLLPLTIGIILNIINSKIMAKPAQMINQMNRIPDRANRLMLTGAAVIPAVLFVPAVVNLRKKADE